MSDEAEPGIIDREIQRRMLVDMSACYPDAAMPEHPSRQQLVNGRYLAEHGLCKCEQVLKPPFNRFEWEFTITAKGLDFLADDGGLSAVLGVVTVKLHADTIRGLIEAKVQASDLPEEKKSRIMTMLRSMPEAGFRALTTDLVQRGLSGLPDATHLLRLVGL